jgi:outer membrane lipoprotein SlyB
MGNIVSNTLDKVGDAFGGEGLISSLGSLAGMVMGGPAGAAIGGGLGSLLEGG